MAAASKQKINVEELNGFCFSSAQIPDTTRPISQDLHSCDVQLDPWEVRNKALIEKSEHKNQGMSQRYSSCFSGMSHGIKSM